MLTKQEGSAVDWCEAAGVAVLGRPNKVDAPIAQLRDLDIVKCRRSQHVDEQLDHQACVARQELAGNCDGLEARGRRKNATNRINGFSELGRVALARTLLQQAGKQACHAGPAIRIGYGATTNNGLEADQRHIALLKQNDDDTIAELNALDGR